MLTQESKVEWSEFFENLVQNDFVDDASFLSETSGGIVGFFYSCVCGLISLILSMDLGRSVCREVPNIDPRYDLASHNESKRAGLSPFNCKHPGFRKDFLPL